MEPVKTTAVTDENGNFDVTVTVGGGPGIKGVTASASVGGTTTGGGTQSKSSSVSEPGTPTTTQTPSTTPAATTTSTTTSAPLTVVAYCPEIPPMGYTYITSTLMSLALPAVALILNKAGYIFLI